MNIFVGCYTQKISAEIVGQGAGIYCFHLDEATGKISLKNTIEQLSPSYLAFSPNKKFLYTFEETFFENQPKVHAYQVTRDGSSLSYLNSQLLPGALPCHLATFKNKLIIACYGTGNVLVYNLDENGSIMPLSQEIQHVGNGPNDQRQEGPHAHMVYPLNEKVFIVDLGIDTIKTYQLNDSEDLLPCTNSDVSVDPGAGSRHMAFDSTGKFAFVMTELTAELYAYKYDGQFTFMTRCQTLPDGYEQTPSGAAIRAHPNGMFVYVSNRGSDAISIFRFDRDREVLEFVAFQSTFGKTPREFNIDPSGNWLLAANQDSHNIVIFQINQSTGLLTVRSINEDVKSPSSILFN